MSIGNNYMKLVRFLGLLLFFYVTWSLIQTTIIFKQVDFFITYQQTVIASQLLNLFSNTFFTPHTLGCLVTYNQTCEIFVSNACNAFIVFFLFGSVIVSFPSGTLKNKALYLVTGLAIILNANIIRIVLLVLTKAYIPTYLDFNHHYLFKIIIYSLVFLIWRHFIHHFPIQKNAE